jgi:hypothetical protein
VHFRLGKLLPAAVAPPHVYAVTEWPVRIITLMEPVSALGASKHHAYRALAQSLGLSGPIGVASRAPAHLWTDALRAYQAVALRRIRLAHRRVDGVLASYQLHHISLEESTEATALPDVVVLVVFQRAQ